MDTIAQGMRKRWKLIALAALMATVMEYSIRGLGAFLAHPLLDVMVYFTYFTWLVIAEYCIGKFGLQDWRLWILAFFAAVSGQLVFSAVYYPPYTFGGFNFGFNMGDLLINNLVWFTTLQTILALYIGRRLLGGRIERSTDLLSTRQVWVIAGVYYGLQVLYRIAAKLDGTAWQYTVLVSLSFIAGLLAVYAIKTARVDQRAESFEPRKFLDILAVATTLYAIISFFVFSQSAGLLNPAAIRWNIILTPILALALIGYRIVSRRPIMV